MSPADEGRAADLEVPGHLTLLLRKLGVTAALEMAHRTDAAPIAKSAG
jgi:hypothetical protein